MKKGIPSRHPTLFAGLLTCLFGSVHHAAADPIQVNARFVREDGSPISAMKVRIVVGSENASRAPSSGKRMVTDADGRIRYEVEAPVQQRKIQLGSFFSRHPSRRIEVGIEMDLLGRRALYWTEIDLVKAGPLGDMSVFVPGSKGRFDQPLQFHAKSHSWSFPGEPTGMRMSGIGAKLLEHNMKQAPSGEWIVDLLFEKQEFTVR